MVGAECNAGMRYPFLIFDLNGTLVDTFDDLTDALNDQLQAIGRPKLTVEQVRQWPGENLRVILRSALALTGPVPTDLEITERLPEFRTSYENQLGARAYLYDGVPEVLQELAEAGVSMAVLTNKPLSASLKILQQMGIASRFQYLLAGDGDMARKPDPEGLLTLVHQLSGEADARDRALMVGSSWIDLHTARNAGVRCALVDQDHSRAVHAMGADYVLDGISRLARLALGTRPSGTWPVPE